MVRPLPRSLDPLPGESLPGFVLRLSHRLGITPLHLARHTGCLSRNYYLPSSILVRLTEPQIKDFATVTRLTTEEIIELTLSPWSSRYLPIARPVGTRPDPWLIVEQRRYCPQCLAGDATVIGQRHGGAWLKRWHLPIVFACPEHQRFLRDGCPGDHADGDQGSQQTFGRAIGGLLHPAQCRRAAADCGTRDIKVCGTRLDQLTTNGPEHRPSLSMLAFQTHLLDVLQGSGSDGDAARYFTDLRLIAALMIASWPHSQHLIDPRHRSLVAAGAQPGDPDRKPKTHVREADHVAIDAPPSNSVVTGAVLLAAHTMLESADLDTTLAALFNATYPRLPTRSPWTRMFARHIGHCSERLGHAAHPVTHAYRKRADGKKLFTTIEPHRYRPENIAAHLEPGWHERYFSHMNEVPVKLLRRTAAVQLVQWVTGGSMADAAAFLGMHFSRQFTSSFHISNWVQAQRDPRMFVTAVHNLARELNHTDNLVDYRKRRCALQDWILAPEAWAGIVDQLPPTRGHIQPVLDDLKRQVASIYVWTRVTHGEHLFAPRPLFVLQPAEARTIWKHRFCTIWFEMVRPNPLKHYAELRILLDPFVRDLTRRIDDDSMPARAN